MSTSFQVNITLDPNTLTELATNGYSLYAFKGVDAPGAPGTMPVVWFQTDRFSSNTVVTWQEEYAGYTSLTTPVAPQVEIVASSSAPMDLGQLMTIGPGGLGTITNDGASSELEILNDTTTVFTTGVSVFNEETNSATPICAFSLPPGNLQELAPIEMVFFMFATTPVNTGTVIEQTFAPGILIDMTGDPGNVTVAFDAATVTGWTGPGNTATFAANANLLPLLVNPGGAGQVAFRAGQRARARQRIA